MAAAPSRVIIERSRIHSYIGRRLLTILVVAAALPIGCNAPIEDQTLSSEDTSDVYWTWVEKYITYQQQEDNTLHLTDASFMAEVIYSERRKIETGGASLYLKDADDSVATFVAADPYAFTNGEYYTRKSKSYDSIEVLEVSVPADSVFVWDVVTDGRQARLPPIRIGGSTGLTQYPALSPMFLSQGDKLIEGGAKIEAGQALTIRWNHFSNGEKLAGSDWEDTIFLMLSDCHGEVRYTSGAPEQGEGFADYSQTSRTIPAGTLEPGMQYIAFLTFIKYVDYNGYEGFEQFAANSFAVELPVQTTGIAADGRDCPDPVRKAPYLWLGKTPPDKGLVPWPGLTQ